MQIDNVYKLNILRPICHWKETDNYFTTCKQYLQNVSSTWRLYRILFYSFTSSPEINPQCSLPSVTSSVSMAPFTCEKHHWMSPTFPSNIRCSSKGRALNYSFSLIIQSWMYIYEIILIHKHRSWVASRYKILTGHSMR